MLRIITLVAALSFGIQALSEPIEAISPSDAGYDENKLKELKNVAEELYQDGRIPNYVIALYKNNKRFFTIAEGKTRLESEPDPRLPAPVAYLLKDGSDVASDTIFHMASMTKPIVTTALLKLVEEGRVSLEDPLTKYFPEFEQMMVAPEGDFGNQFEPAKRQITILDLVRHTSGFSYPEAIAGFGDVGKLYGELGVFGDRTKNMEEHLSNLAELPLVAHPGESFNYSVSVDVIGALIEQVSGMDLATYLDEVLFEPLGMSDTGFALDVLQVPRASDIYGSQPIQPEVPYREIGRLDSSDIDWKLQNVIPAAFYQQAPEFYSGGGGLLSTADDYAKYLMMIANGGNYEGVNIIKPETTLIHTQPLITDISALAQAFGDAAQYMTFGGGFGIKNEPENLERVDYFFWAGAFNTFFWVDPADRSVGLFLTAHWPVQYNISDRLEQIVDEARIK